MSLLVKRGLIVSILILLLAFCFVIAGRRFTTRVDFLDYGLTEVRIDNRKIGKIKGRGIGILSKRLGKGVHKIITEGPGDDPREARLILPPKFQTARDSVVLRTTEESTLFRSDVKWIVNLEEVIILQHDVNYLEDLDFTPAGDRLVVACGTGEIYIWNMQTFELENRLAYPGELADIAMSPSEPVMAKAAYSTMPGIMLLDLNQGDWTSLSDQPCSVIAFSPDGNRLAGANVAQSRLRVWDVQTKEVLFDQDQPCPMETLAFIDGRDELLLGDETNWATYRWDLEMDRKVWGPEPEPGYAGSEVWDLHVHQGGSRFASGEHDSVFWSNTQTGDLIWAFSHNYETGGYWRPFTKLDLHPDGKVLAVTGILGKVWFVSTEDGTELGTIEGSGVVGANIRFSPDGKFLARATTLGEVRVWSVEIRPNTSPLF